jgi:hypothetical protein
MQYHNFHEHIQLLYHSEVEMKETTESDISASYQNISFNIDSNGRLTTRLYDKRNDFNFAIVSFPFLFSNILHSPAYGVYLQGGFDTQEHVLRIRTFQSDANY